MKGTPRSDTQQHPEVFRRYLLLYGLALCQILDKAAVVHCGQKIRDIARTFHNLDPANHHVAACSDLLKGFRKLGIDLKARQLGDEDGDVDLPYLIMKGFVDPRPHHPDDSALDVTVLLPLEAEAFSKCYDENTEQVAVCRRDIHEHIYAVTALTE